MVVVIVGGSVDDANKVVMVAIGGDEVVVRDGGPKWDRKVNICTLFESRMPAQRLLRRLKRQA